MNKRTQNTENNKMLYLTENDDPCSESHNHDFCMDFNTNIVLFTLYPSLMNDDDDTLLPMEHGMALLDIALSTKDELSAIIIISTVMTVSYQMGITELLDKACQYMPGPIPFTTEDFLAKMGSPSIDLSEYRGTVAEFLSTLGITEEEEEKAIQEILIMARQGDKQ